MTDGKGFGKIFAIVVLSVSYDMTREQLGTKKMVLAHSYLIKLRSVLLLFYVG